MCFSFIRATCSGVVCLCMCICAAYICVHLCAYTPERAEKER